MSDKQKKKEAMDNLLNGLTMPGQSVAQEEQTQEPAAAISPAAQVRAKGKRGRPPRSSQEETAYLVVNKEKYAKIRAIAAKSGTTIKEVNDIAWGHFIETYEKKHGVVRVQRTSKQDLTKIFDED